MKPDIQYRTYTIRWDSDRQDYMYFLTEQGEDHDYDYEDGCYQYCGNCKWAFTVECAKTEIDSLLTPVYLVINPESKTITKFNFWSDAKEFCDKVGLAIEVAIKMYVDDEEIQFDSI